MPMVKAEKIWYNGELVAWDDAKVHVLSHALHYGTSFFEGARCYKTEKGPACFRIQDHMRRIIDSLKIYRTESPYTVDEFVEAVKKTIRANRLDSCYIRPIVFRGYGELGVNPAHCPLETVIAVWGWGAYLGADALEKGVNVCVSSWNRLAPNTMPNMAKVGGNYMNSQLIKMDAMASGFDEGIGLDSSGMVSEGSGENIFIVRNDTIYTPELTSALEGITRDTIFMLAAELGYEVKEKRITRDEVYCADEAFFTGSAAEVTPIRELDNRQIGNGGRGPVTEKLQTMYFDQVHGRRDLNTHWQTLVEPGKSVK